MPKENKKSSTTRLSDDVLADLRQIRAPYLATGPIAPASAAIVRDAWHFAKDHGWSYGSDVAGTGTGTPKAQIGKDLTAVSKDLDISLQFKEIQRKLDILVARGKTTAISAPNGGDFKDSMGRIHKTEADMLKAEKALQKAQRGNRSA